MKIARMAIVAWGLYGYAKDPRYVPNVAQPTPIEVPMAASVKAMGTVR